MVKSPKKPPRTSTFGDADMLVGRWVEISETGANEKGELSGLLSREGAETILKLLS